MVTFVWTPQAPRRLSSLSVRCLDHDVSCSHQLFSFFFPFYLHSSIVNIQCRLKTSYFKLISRTYIPADVIGENALSFICTCLCSPKFALFLRSLWSWPSGAQSEFLVTRSRNQMQLMMWKSFVPFCSVLETYQAAHRVQRKGWEGSAGLHDELGS